MIRVEHDSDVGMARRAARDAAESAGLDEEAVGRAALVATEAATNLARHAEQGAFFVRRLEAMEGKGIEVMAVDRGPGMGNVERFMEDGATTTGSPGQGLGAMKRLADSFCIDSHPGEGTVLVAQIRRALPVTALTLGGLTAGISADGCGDAFAVEVLSSGARVIVVDGLGHGAEAADAAASATKTFRDRSRADLGTLFQRLDEVLRPTRGAAIAVAELDLTAKVVRFMGIGNISAVLISDIGARNLVSHNGIVGHTMRRTQAFDYTYLGSPTLILHTDGIATRWRPSSVSDRGLVHPAIIAGRLWRSEARGRDDAGILVLRGRA
ncbi:MAG: serine/threonine protein kinase [Alphaproteobacteria bacterium]|nr:serine/threonine protein kinase [Alphaproteobacteria bacterium]